MESFHPHRERAEATRLHDEDLDPLGVPSPRKAHLPLKGVPLDGRIEGFPPSFRQGVGRKSRLKPVKSWRGLSSRICLSPAWRSFGEQEKHDPGAEKGDEGPNKTTAHRSVLTTIEESSPAEDFGHFLPVRGRHRSVLHRPNSGLEIF